MIVETLSSHEPPRVSVEHVRGFTNVWLRDNVAEDADDMPDGGSRSFWRADEVAFSVPGILTAAEIESQFDALWTAHENDGRPVSEVATEALGTAREAKASAETPDPALAAVARIAVASIPLTNATATDVAVISDYIPAWEDVSHFEQNDPCVYKGTIYRASKAHDRQDIYPPDVAGESMYYPIEVAPDGVIVYRTCHGEYDMVRKGEKRHYPDASGPVYRAKQDADRSPTEWPDYWELVTDAA